MTHVSCVLLIYCHMTGEESPEPLPKRYLRRRPVNLSFRTKKVPARLYRGSDPGRGLDLANVDAVEQALDPATVDPAGPEVLGRLGSAGHSVGEAALR